MPDTPPENAAGFAGLPHDRQPRTPGTDAPRGPGETTPAGSAVRKIRREYEASHDRQVKIGDPWITRREALALLRWIETR